MKELQKQLILLQTNDTMGALTAHVGDVSIASLLKDASDTATLDGISAKQMRDTMAELQGITLLTDTEHLFADTEGHWLAANALANILLIQMIATYKSCAADAGCPDVVHALEYGTPDAQEYHTSELAARAAMCRVVAARPTTESTLASAYALRALVRKLQEKSET